MKYEFNPFGAEHLDEAVSLFTEAYLREKLASPQLPELERMGNGRGRGFLRDALRAAAQNPGVAACREGRLCGFMLETMRFEWKGQKAAGCEEFAHGASGADREGLYRLLYQELAHRWVDEGRHLHIIRHFAHDAVLKENLYLLGFGAILAEELRVLEPIGATAAVDVIVDPAPRLLLDLQKEHRRYYRESPIFLRKDSSDESILRELEDHLQEGDRLFALREEDQFVGLFIAGTSAAAGEGLLLRQTNSAQLKSAYVRPAGRARGLGTALLNRAITWAGEQGYDRLLVEHETANIPGSAFWGKYFAPFVYTSMRYVDNTL